MGQQRLSGRAGHPAPAAAADRRRRSVSGERRPGNHGAEPHRATPRPRGPGVLACAGYTALAYLAVGLPLAVLPVWTVRAGFGPTVAGLVVSAQYLATTISRGLVGPMIDRSGPRCGVLLGFLCCAASGLATILAFQLSSSGMALGIVVVGRMLLGVGESLVSTSAMVWGILRVGDASAARMISWNGIATYGAIAAGAPIGVLVQGIGGFTLLAAVMLFTGVAGYALARPQPATRAPAALRLPMRRVFTRVLPLGAALALATMGFGVVTTFITLFFVASGWQDGWMAFTAFGCAFVASRLLFASGVTSGTGLRIAARSLALEIGGLLLICLSNDPASAVAGAAITGFGFAMIFPALGVLVIERVPPQSRGAAIGAFALFVDLALGLAGPLAGALAERSTFAAPFAAAAVCALLALCLVQWLRRSSTRARA
ncbi:MFS transporter [Sphingomonas desiccabilis]|uniref:MFS transporter n=1 Tax=Sphingomonas desiccabilis TaxID=429134 RepID=UPI001F0EE251|nr:MFS transporter [Sphingomonas desiccabilis]